MTRRYVAGGAAALGSAAVSVLFAVPAYACSCVQRPMEAALEHGGTVVIVTRTDDTPNDARGPDGGLPVGTFRVEDHVGPKPPAVLRGTLDTGGSCRPYVAPGALAALSAGRGKDGTWTVGGCGDGYPFGPALQLVEGDPEPVRGGPAVAYAAGEFGSGRLAAVDEHGTVFAWDRTPGSGSAVAVCPGGGTVVALGQAPPPRKPTPKDFGPPEKGRTEVTAHDATDLGLRHRVVLDVAAGEHVRALRCLDAAGNRVDLVATERGDREHTGRLVQVRDEKMTSVPLGNISDAQALSDGFMVRDEERERTSFSRLGPNGRLTPVAAVDAGIETWKVSPDGRTIAAYSYLGKKLRNTIVTLDVETGERLGRSPRREYVTGLAWTASGLLLARESTAYRQHPNRVFAFDRTSTGRGEWPAVAGEWAGRFDAIGDAAVVYGSGSRLIATPRSGDPLVAESFRTAAAAHVVPASADAAFAVDQTQPTVEAEVTFADDPGDQPWSTGALAGAVAGTSAGAGLLGAVFVLRRRSRQAGAGR